MFFYNLSPVEQFAVLPVFPLVGLISVNNVFVLIALIVVFFIINLLILFKNFDFNKLCKIFTDLGNKLLNNKILPFDSKNYRSMLFLMASLSSAQTFSTFFGIFKEFGNKLAHSKSFRLIKAGVVVSITFPFLLSKAVCDLDETRNTVADWVDPVAGVLLLAFSTVSMASTVAIPAIFFGIVLSEILIDTFFELDPVKDAVVEVIKETSGVIEESSALINSGVVEDIFVNSSDPLLGLYMFIVFASLMLLYTSGNLIFFGGPSPFSGVPDTGAERPGSNDIVSDADTSSSASSVSSMGSDASTSFNESIDSAELDVDAFDLEFIGARAVVASDGLLPPQYELEFDNGEFLTIPEYLDRLGSSKVPLHVYLSLEDFMCVPQRDLTSTSQGIVSQECWDVLHRQAAFWDKEGKGNPLEMLDAHGVKGEHTPFRMHTAEDLKDSLSERLWAHIERQERRQNLESERLIKKQMERDAYFYNQPGDPYACVDDIRFGHSLQFEKGRREYFANLKNDPCTTVAAGSAAPDGHNIDSVDITSTIASEGLEVPSNHDIDTVDVTCTIASDALESPGDPDVSAGNVTLTIVAEVVDEVLAALNDNSC